MAFSTVLASAASWQYQQAVIVEKKEKNAFVLTTVCIFASTFTAIISALVGIAAYSLSPETEWAKKVWFLLLPLSTFIGGVTPGFSALANRKRKYKILAVTQIVTNMTTTVCSLGLGFAGFTYAGLMIAYFLGQITSFLIMFATFLHLKRSCSLNFRSRRIKFLAYKHRMFALFTSPAAFIGNYSQQLPIYALSALDATPAIGLFSRARQLLTMPATLLGNSIAQVFQQQGAADFASEGNCLAIYKKTFVFLSLAGIVPTITLAFLAPSLFAWFLGENWRAAGEIARIISPLLYLQVVCSPLSSVFYIAGAQIEDFVLTISTTLLLSAVIFLACYIQWQPNSIIASYSACYSIIYAVYIARGFSLARGVDDKGVGA